MGCSSSSSGNDWKVIGKECKVAPQTIREPFLEDDEISYEQRESTKLNVLCVLFSSPLAWKDRQTHRLNPIEMLDFGDERETIVQAFKEAQRDVSINFDYATTDSLRTLVTLGCRALHFSGHGHQNHLNLEDGKSGLHIMTIEKLKELSQAGDMKLDFVFVSACYSQKAGKAFVEAGVPHVVCVRLDAQLLDTAANDFTKAFYFSLAMGHTVKHAFEIGKSAVISSPRVPNSMMESDKFLLLPEDSNHERPIFIAPFIPDWPSSKQSLPLLLQNQLPSTSHLPLPPDDFQGREVDMHRVIHEIMSRRFVSVVGDRSVGKTSVVKAVCVYVTERRVFTTGVVFVRLKDIRTYSDFLYRLRQALLSGPVPVVAHLKKVLRQCEDEQRDNESSSRYSPRYSPRGFFPSSSNNAAAERTRSFCDSEIDSVRLDGSVSTLTNTATPEEEDKEFDYGLQEALKACLQELNLLLVLDHVDTLLNTDKRTIFQLRSFLAVLLETCPKIKILSTSKSCLRLEDSVECDVRENTVSVGPLTLGASLRLYTSLSPCLIKGSDREAFVRRVLSALPRGQESVSVHSGDLSPMASGVLKVLGSGYPSRIIVLAAEADDAEIQAIVKIVSTKPTHLPNQRQHAASQQQYNYLAQQHEPTLALPTLAAWASEDSCWQPQRDTPKKSDTDMLLELLTGDSSAGDIQSSSETYWTVNTSRTACL